MRSAHRGVDVVEANRDGQQLYFADMILKHRGVRQPLRHQPVTPRGWWPSAYPVAHRQLVLFESPPDLARGHLHGFSDPPLPELAAGLEQAVREHAVTHGWKRSTAGMTIRGIRILLATQDTPGAPIKASEAAGLSALPFVAVQPVLEVLGAVGMLEDDRPAPLEAWFMSHTAGLAEPMRSETRSWFLALRDGSTIAPRTRPRSVSTVRHRVMTVTPALRAWTTAGHQSLREITNQDVRDVLPPDGHQRAKALSSLRSLFRFLKGRKVIFVNPSARMRAERVQRGQPLPIDLQPVRDLLNSPDPARAALAALIAFHAPRNGQLRALLLTDVRDGRVHLDDITVVLADPVRARINAWLDERARRWPNTANPHLFINKHTAVRTCPVSIPWITTTLGISAQAIREDRILHESLATRGDVRRLTDLFGLTVGGAERYVIPIEPKPTVT